MRVKFICLNLWLGGKLFEPMLDFLKKENVDILALQEVYDGKNAKLEKRFRSMDILAKKFDMPHYFFSPACVDVRKEGKITNGNAVFSRFPIIESKTTFFDIPFGERTNYEDFSEKRDFTQTPRNIQTATLKINSQEINVFNTQGIWGKDGNDSERRLKMSETIIREIEKKENVILAGDFNVWPETETIKMIENDLTNIFKGKISTTFNLKRKDPEFIPMIVDYIFASKNLKIIDSYCPQVDISDHFPLVCVFDIQEESI